MVEVGQFFGKNIADAARSLRGGDRKRKPEFPLSPMEITRLEEENKQILEKEDFGRKDFVDFCSNTIVLARRERDSGKHSMLHDTEGRVLIDIFEDTISVRVYPETTENSSKLGSLNQDVSYSPQKKDGGFFGMSHSDFQPVLTTHARVPVPDTTEFFSFFSGKSEQAFHKGLSRVNRQEIVSDQEVQGFLRRVDAVYNLNKATLNSPPR